VFFPIFALFLFSYYAGKKVFICSAEFFFNEMQYGGIGKYGEI